ncbi:TRAP transporter large permease [Afifella sp. IM 167]|uniref:TRAP transporter large permease n=1 Tax=Afifella sp. IM 167 TaxID=2033586 RepID=UPI001CCF815F|nr:TRAP transporter large permease subunit [Afifella sp. IM 167]MBZ8134647.1 C4-dicarboxylate ABC transporter permease [Afifella sp. IM 167]
MSEEEELRRAAGDEMSEVLHSEGGGSGLRSLILPLLVVLLAVAVYVTLSSGVAREIRGMGGVGVMLVCMALGMPIAIAMAMAGGFGLFALVGVPAVISAFENLPFHSAANWSYSVLPMFILMGIILWRSGVTDRVFAAARAWLNWLPGGLAVATNFAGAGLAAASGSTLGISFALGRIAVPEMLKSGYDRGLAAGVVIMAGTLGQLIPPSILLVIYAGVAQVPVGPLLIAAVVPGVMTACAYATMIVLRVAVNPRLAPRSATVVPWAERFSLLGQVWPVPFLILVVIGGLFTGVFTATETGAYAAGAAIGIAFIFSGRRAFGQIGHALMDTASALGSILILIVGVTLLNRFLALSGLPFAMSGFIDSLGLGRVEFLIAVMVFYLVLGMFMDPLAIMLLTIPIFTPTLHALDIDLLWYGIFAVAMGELAIVTPPVGILSYLVHKLINGRDVLGDARPITLGEVFGGTGWFVATQLIILLVLIFFPEIVNWLPRLSKA